jgi:hypothetical protein
MATSESLEMVFHSKVVGLELITVGYISARGLMLNFLSSKYLTGFSLEAIVSCCLRSIGCNAHYGRKIYCFLVISKNTH